eukprot:1181176-Prorocentrum_minimum.AAC.2
MGDARLQDMVALVLDTIRERKPTVPVPSALAKLAVFPMDFMQSKVPFPWAMPVAGGSFTADAVDSMASDYVASGNLPGATRAT